MFRGLLKISKNFEDLHSLFGQPMPVFHHLHSTKVLPNVQREPPVFQIVSVASILGTGKKKEEEKV